MKKILILGNNAIGLYSFRFELIKELIKQGYEVHFSLPESDDDEKVKLIMEAGAKFRQIPINRRGMNPFEDIKLIREYKKAISIINPDIILTYTIKPNIYGTYAASCLDKPVIINITGIGTSLTSSKLKVFIKLLYRFACGRSKLVFFQNQNNHSLFINNKIVNTDKTVIIPGSGVNTEKFRPVEKVTNDEITRFLFIGRIMKEKGIDEYIQASKNIKLKYPLTEFQIVGMFEEEKYKNILVNENGTGIKYLGVSSDVRNEIREVDCIVNPSYHEGMSNILLEGAAMGKPLIATDIPGCREIVEDGVNGFLCFAKSACSLEEKIINFIELDNNEKEQMSQKAREKVVSEFDRNIVITSYIKAIEIILNVEKKYEPIY